MNPWYITGCQVELLALGAVGIGSLLRVLVLLCRWFAMGLEEDRLRTTLERDNLAHKYLLEQHRSLSSITRTSSGDKQNVFLDGVSLDTRPPVP